jgi:hypothetical protein
VTSATDSVLASIDGALTEYGYVGNDGGGMRWRPEEPEAIDAEWFDVDDWPDPGDDAWGPFTVRLHFREPGNGWNICLKAEARRADQMPGLARGIKAYYAERPGCYPRPASHCSDCNPRGNPGPLAVNGRAYQRRLRNRRRR